MIATIQRVLPLRHLARTNAPRLAWPLRCAPNASELVEMIRFILRSSSESARMYAEGGVGKGLPFPCELVRAGMVSEMEEPEPVICRLRGPGEAGDACGLSDGDMRGPYRVCTEMVSEKGSPPQPLQNRRYSLGLRVFSPSSDLIFPQSALEDDIGNVGLER